MPKSLNFSNTICWLLVISQLFLLWVAFGDLLLQDAMFQNTYDGLKGYHAWYSYILNIGHDTSLFHTQAMNYPYGEWVLYTDSTPLLAIFGRIGQDWFEIKHPIRLFNLFFLLAIPLTSLFFYNWLRLAGVTVWIAFSGALLFPWMSPMLLRLGFGHFNLSLSIFLVLAFYYSFLVYKCPDQIVSIAIRLGIVMLIAVCIHVYYLGLMGSIVIIFALLAGLFQYVQTRKWHVRYGVLMGVPVVVALLFLGGVHWIDTELSNRLPGAGGYNWDDWNFRLENIIKADSKLHGIALFPYGKPFWHTYEQYGFVGHGWLLATPFLLGIGIYHWKRFLRSWLPVVFLVSLAGLIMSIGETPVLFGKHVTNYLNPFYYGSRLTESVKQFRCLSRFYWIFFTGFQFMGWWAMSRVWRWPKWRLLVIVVVALSTFETFHILQTAQTFHKPNLFHETLPLKTTINPTAYEAILPIPFYISGSDKPEYTMDPEDSWYQQMVQLSVATRLPLIASKMGRSSIPQTKNMLALFMEEPSPLRKQLSQLSKPLLLVVSKNEEQYPSYSLDPAQKILSIQRDWVNQQKTRLIQETDACLYYELIFE